MNRLSSRHRSPLQAGSSAAGFTLIEVAITAAILVVLGGVVLNLDRAAFEREEINSLALGLASWLETVQRGAQRTTGGCVVTFSTGTSLASGSVLATVSGGDTSVAVSDCTNEPSFVIGSVRPGSTFTAAADFTDPITFTPRGTITATATRTITLRPTNRTITRCVRLFANSGMIAIGANNNSTTSCGINGYTDSF
jgi:Tfp pilus assembly protein FimT